MMSNDLSQAACEPREPRVELTLAELVHATGGELVFGTDQRGDAGDVVLQAIVTDSRQVRPGEVFWALPGSRLDGADFVADAFQRGAAGAVCGPRRIHAPPGRWLVAVDDALRALGRLAADRRSRLTGRVVAVTGSVGKTTARTMIDTVLSSALPGIASPKNYNNHVGLPLSMLALRPDDRYAVFELGASAPGEIGELADLAKPHMGVITRIGDAHLASFGSQQAIAQSKAELLAALPDDGCAILNGDDVWLRRAAIGCPVPTLWVGRGTDCDITATHVRWQPGRLRFRVDGQAFEVPTWGRHHLTSALLSIGVARMFGMDDRAIAAALATYVGPPRRCQVTEHRGVTIIDDTYNASPVAMRAALELLRDMPTAGRRIVVCGDMLELGDAAIAAHEQLGRDVVSHCGADRLIACGELAETVADAACRSGMPSEHVQSFRDASLCLVHLGQLVGPGDTVLVKGSRGMALERFVDHLTSGAALPSVVTAYPNHFESLVPLGETGTQA